MEREAEIEEKKQRLAWEEQGKQKVLKIYKKIFMYCIMEIGW